MVDPIEAVDAIDGVSTIDSTTDIQPMIPPPPAGAEDAVSFSIPAQIFLLAQQGVGVREIASELHVSKEEVLIDLDFIVTKIAPIGPSITPKK